MEPNQRIAEELERAATARSEGNEGMARVCARRAAGLAVAEYLRKNDIQVNGLRSYDLLRNLSLRNHLPEAVHPGLSKLSLTVDENHNLADGIDLINEAKLIIHKLTEEVQAS